MTKRIFSCMLAALCCLLAALSPLGGFAGGRAAGVAWQKAPLWKGGRLRAPPVAEKASKKEWQWSKFCEHMRAKNFGHRNRSWHGAAVTEGLPEVAGHHQWCFRRAG